MKVWKGPQRQIRRRRIAFALAGAGSALVALLAVAGLRTLTRPVRAQGVRGVIFGQRAAARTLGVMLDADPYGFWSPTRRDILALERQLTAQAQREQPDWAATQLTGVERQYFGFTRQGARRIYVVGYCPAEGFDAWRQFAAVGEPDACHFEAEYDLESGTLQFFWLLQ